MASLRNRTESALPSGARVLNIFKLIRKSTSAKQTSILGRTLAPFLKPGDVLALSGDLGAGKTVFVQGLAAGLGVKNKKEVRSPTFALINEYPGPRPLCHADLYRLEEAQALGLGLEEYWQGADWIAAIEWAEKAPGLLPREALNIRLTALGETERQIEISGKDLWKKRLARFS